MDAREKALVAIEAYADDRTWPNVKAAQDAIDAYAQEAHDAVCRNCMNLNTTMTPQELDNWRQGCAQRPKEGR